MLPGVNNLQFGNGDEISNGAYRTTSQTKCICHATLVFRQRLENFNVPAVDALQTIAAGTDARMISLGGCSWLSSRGPSVRALCSASTSAFRLAMVFLAWTSLFSMFFVTLHFVRMRSATSPASFSFSASSSRQFFILCFLISKGMRYSLVLLHQVVIELAKLIVSWTVVSKGLFLLLCFPFLLLRLIRAQTLLIVSIADTTRIFGRHHTQYTLGFSETSYASRNDCDPSKLEAFYSLPCRSSQQ